MAFEAIRFMSYLHFDHERNPLISLSSKTTNRFVNDICSFTIIADEKMANLFWWLLSCCSYKNSLVLNSN